MSAYEGTIRTALHRLKFQKRRRLAEPLGVLFIQYLSKANGLAVRDLDYIVPIPLHLRRLQQRGFNQAELLAQQVGKYFEVPVAPALVRVKETAPQFDLPREARFTNIRGAFKVAEPQAVYNKKVLLLDDILTTGATVAECSQVLKKAGAKRVEIAALARALND